MDVFLGCIAALATVTLFAKLAEHTFDVFFWAAVVAGVGSVVLATHWRTPVSGALLFLSLRCGVAFATTLHLSALAIGLVALGGCIIVGNSSTR